jgi:hypothetical protein
MKDIDYKEHFESRKEKRAFQPFVSLMLVETRKSIAARGPELC